MSTVNIHCQFTPGEYRVLEGMAKRMDTQVHVLIEKSIRRGLGARVAEAKASDADIAVKRAAARAENPPRMRPMRLPDELCDDVKALNLLGKNDTEISKELHITISQARARRVFMNLPARSRRGRPSQLQKERNTMPTTDTAPDLSPAELATVTRFGLDREGI